MKSTLKIILFIAVVFIGIYSCGGNSSIDKFVGTYSFNGCEWSTLKPVNLQMHIKSDRRVVFTVNGDYYIGVGQIEKIKGSTIAISIPSIEYIYGIRTANGGTSTRLEATALPWIFDIENNLCYHGWQEYENRGYSNVTAYPFSLKK